MKEDLTKSRYHNINSAVELFYGRFFLLIILLEIFPACQNRKELLTQEVYEGPIIEMDSVFTIMSDSAKVLVRLTAPKQLNFEGGDREWPQGIFLELLEDDGQTVESTFRSNYAKYTQKDDVYKGEGDVLVKNSQNGDELSTEELFWTPKDELFHTEKFVTIVSDGEIHTGEGLTADQDFSTYTIHKPAGTISIEEDQ
ncbi:MAG: LPS export ABC transporter periplasmic protein LptC [Cyclobacteriaceae bacterium]|nr:LPS export ABC transporter periplasmic protein LptC [Cyclobacteriaceae bacterium HetDA_MAG_MS6]